MCDRDHFHRLEDRVDRLENDAIKHHTKVDEQIKTLFSSCERLGAASGRLMWSLIALLGIVLLLSVCALVYGALGDHGFNAVTAAAQSAQGVAR